MLQHILFAAGIPEGHVPELNGMLLRIPDRQAALPFRVREIQVFKQFRQVAGIDFVFGYIEEQIA